VLADVPPAIPDVPPVAPPPQSASSAVRPSSRREPDGGRELFLIDAGAALAVANESRYRTLERVFGIKRSDANLLTAILALMVGNSVYEKVAVARPPRPPSIPNLAIGVGALRESIYGVAGPASRDTPLGGTLIALAILGGLAGPPALRSIRGTRASYRRLHQTFLGRYGHLVGRGSGTHSARPS
jgi:hypothetical protein